MKVRRQLARLEPIVLDPLHGVSGEEWSRAPEAKWSLAQIVEHLAIAMDVVAEHFERRAEKQGMVRRATPAQALLRHALLGLGRLPRGMRAPDVSLPSDHPDPELVAARFRMGVERTRTLVETWAEERQRAVFLPHPVIGDLNLPEWVRFHYVHCRLHARQIDKRLQWLRS